VSVVSLDPPQADKAPASIRVSRKVRVFFVICMFSSLVGVFKYEEIIGQRDVARNRRKSGIWWAFHPEFGITRQEVGGYTLLDEIVLHLPGLISCENIPKIEFCPKQCTLLSDRVLIAFQ
jgi:hypothetical protein